MGDFIKIAAKIALIAVITTAVLAVFAGVTIPGLDLTLFSQGFSSALAIYYHYVPAASIVVPLSFTMLNIILALKMLDFTLMAVRWVMKVNE